MKTLLKILFLSLFFYLIGTSILFAFSKATHKAINEYIARNPLGPPNNIFSFNSYLKDQLGFANGDIEIINSHFVYKWIGKGGESEDEPFLRGAKHFHNPITNEGFSGIWGVENIFDGVSSILWSPLRCNGEGQFPGPDFSWCDVRDYFYQALTSTSEKKEINILPKHLEASGSLCT